MDILERLRAHPKIDGSVTEQHRIMVGQRHEAAAEIERLRAELRQCAVEMDEAANLIAPNFPRAATLFTTAAQRVRRAYEQKGSGNGP